MQLELVQSKRNLREAFSCYYARQKRRSVLRWICGLVLLFWLVTPLYMVVSMGARAGAGLGEILRVYPRFMIQEGWLTSAVWVLLVLFILLSPSLLGRIDTFFYIRANRMQPGRKLTLVLADWRLVLYDEEGRQVNAMPYGQIRWMERTAHSFVLCVGWRQVLGISLDEMDLETEEAVEELLRQRIQCPPPVPVELALPGDDPAQGAPVFEAQVELEPDDLPVLVSMQLHNPLVSRRIALVLGIQAVVVAAILLGSDLSPWSWLVIPLLLAAELLWLRGPGAARRQLSRSLRRAPDMAQVLSGRIRLDHQTIRRDNAQVQSRFGWKDVHQTMSGPAGLLLLNRQGLVVAFVPARCFASAEQLSTISAWAAGCAAEERKKAKSKQGEKN